MFAEDFNTIYINYCVFNKLVYYINIKLKVGMWESAIFDMPIINSSLTTLVVMNNS